MAATSSSESSATTRCTGSRRPPAGPALTSGRCGRCGTRRGVARCRSLAPTQANAPEITTGYRESYHYDPAGNLVDLFYQVTTGAGAPSWHRVMGVDAVSNRVTSGGRRPAVDSTACCTSSTAPTASP